MSGGRVGRARDPGQQHQPGVHGHGAERGGRPRGAQAGVDGAEPDGQDGDEGGAVWRGGFAV